MFTISLLPTSISPAELHCVSGSLYGVRQSPCLRQRVPYFYYLSATNQRVPSQVCIREDLNTKHLGHKNVLWVMPSEFIVHIGRVLKTFFVLFSSKNIYTVHPHISKLNHVLTLFGKKRFSFHFKSNLSKEKVCYLVNLSFHCSNKQAHLSIQ